MENTRSTQFLLFLTTPVRYYSLLLFVPMIISGIVRAIKIHNRVRGLVIGLLKVNDRLLLILLYYTKFSSLAFFLQG